jgi:uncharacterized protein YidB (DUF937 family)
MGLLDILTGMRNGPGGAPQPQAPSGGGGMPTWMMALLGLLAYKAIKGGGLGNAIGGGTQRESRDDRALPAGPQVVGLSDILGGMFGGGRPGMAPTSQTGGGLGDLLGGALGGGRGTQGGLGGILGGLLAGGAAGGVLNGGLRHLVTDMENNGQGGAARSWVGTGENQSLEPDELARAVGLDDIEAVAHQTGLPREQVVSDLSQHLPDFINRLTPDGRLPTDDEASRWV